MCTLSCNFINVTRFVIVICLIKCKKINKCSGKHQCNKHLHFPGQHCSFQGFFQTFPYIWRLWSFRRLVRTLKISRINSITVQIFPGYSCCLWLLSTNSYKQYTLHILLTCNCSTCFKFQLLQTIKTEQIPLGDVSYPESSNFAV